MWIGLFLLRTRFICRLLWSRHCLPLLPSGLFYSGFPTKTLYTAFLSPICATRPALRIPTTSYWCTIFSAESSPHKTSLIWNIKRVERQIITSPWCCHFMQIPFLCMLFHDANDSWDYICPKSHVDWSGTKPMPPRWDASNSPPEQLHTLRLFFNKRTTPEELRGVCLVVSHVS
jgi:hypothetical protein